MITIAGLVYYCDKKNKTQQKLELELYGYIIPLKKAIEYLQAKEKFLNALSEEMNRKCILPHNRTKRITGLLI